MDDMLSKQEHNWGEKYAIVLNAGDRWGDVLTNPTLLQTMHMLRIIPSEPYIMQSVKFPNYE